MLRNVLSICAVPFMVALVGSALAYLATGPTLGLYFAGIALSAILVPQLCAIHSRRIDAILSAAAVVDAIALIWFITLFVSPTTFGQWLAAYIVLAVFALAILSIAHLSARIQIPQGVTTILAIAWLTWPVWLSPHLNATIVRILVPAHPLLALNHVLIDQGIWTQQRLMYQFTTLGQDVPYALPSSILPCVFLHTLIALALFPLARSREASSVSAVSSAP